MCGFNNVFFYFDSCVFYKNEKKYNFFFYLLFLRNNNIMPCLRLNIPLIGEKTSVENNLTLFLLIHNY